MFPGLINLLLIFAGLFGPILTVHFADQMAAVGLAGPGLAPKLILLAADLWLTCSMVAAYGLKKLEEWGRVAVARAHRSCTWSATGHCCACHRRCLLAGAAGRGDALGQDREDRRRG